MINGFFIGQLGSSTSGRREAAKQQADDIFVTTNDPDYVSEATGTVYYISALGNDNNDGISIDTPFLTTNKIEAITLYAGDIVAFRRGDTWNDSLSISNSGSVGNPIIITSYGSGARPIINANADFSTSWVSDNSYHADMYKTSVATEKNRLWKDGVEQKSITQRENQLFTYGWNEMGIDDCVWEWYDGYIWYYSPTGIPNGQFHASSINNAFNINSRSNIMVSGVDMRGGNECVDVQNSDNCILEYCTVGRNSSSGIRADDSNYLLVERNTIDSNFHLKWQNLPASYSGTDNRDAMMVLSLMEL